jgi:hypothetical protein
MKKFNVAMIASFCLGLICLAAKFITESIDATKSHITSDGVLMEPFFFLIPVGLFFLITGVLLLAIKVTMNVMHIR